MSVTREKILAFRTERLCRRLDRRERTHVYTNWFESIGWHHDGYAQRCYGAQRETRSGGAVGTGNSASGVVLTGNWNDLDLGWDPITRERWRPRLSKLPEMFLRACERLGIECEWSDEWRECCECNKLVRIEPDSMWWRPPFVVAEREQFDGIEEGSIVCRHCARKLRPRWGVSWRKIRRAEGARKAAQRAAGIDRGRRS